MNLTMLIQTEVSYNIEIKVLLYDCITAMTKKRSGVDNHFFCKKYIVKGDLK